MRNLWTEEHVDFTGRYHRVPDAGINPLPLQRPIPIWFGGQSDPVIRRAARLGDGWMPLYNSAAEAASGLKMLDKCLSDAGRTRADIGLEARIPYGNGNSGLWREQIAGWQEAGATHASLVATNSGLQGSGEHIRALEKFARGVQLL